MTAKKPSRVRVLVLEDDLMMGSYHKAQLERLGYEVLATADGKDALDMIGKNQDLELGVIDLRLMKHDEDGRLTKDQQPDQGEDIIRAIGKINSRFRCVVVTSRPLEELRSQIDVIVREHSEPFKEDSYSAAVEVLESTSDIMSLPEVLSLIYKKEGAPPSPEVYGRIDEAFKNAPETRIARRVIVQLSVPPEFMPTGSRRRGALTFDEYYTKSRPKDTPLAKRRLLAELLGKEFCPPWLVDDLPSEAPHRIPKNELLAWAREMLSRLRKEADGASVPDSASRHESMEGDGVEIIKHLLDIAGSDDPDLRQGALEELRTYHGQVQTSEVGSDAPPASSAEVCIMLSSRSTSDAALLIWSKLDESTLIGFRVLLHLATKSALAMKPTIDEYEYESLSAQAKGQSGSHRQKAPAGVRAPSKIYESPAAAGLTDGTSVTSRGKSTLSGFVTRFKKELIAVRIPERLTPVACRGDTYVMERPEVSKNGETTGEEKKTRRDTAARAQPVVQLLICPLQDS